MGYLWDVVVLSPQDVFTDAIKDVLEYGKVCICHHFNGSELSAFFASGATC